MIRTDENKKARVAVTAAGDLIAVAVAYVTAFYLRSIIPLPLVQDFMPFDRFMQVRHYWSFLLISQIVLLYFFGLYDPIYQTKRRRLLVHVPVALLIQFLSLVTFYFFRGEFLFPRSIFVAFYCINTVLVFAWRGLVVHWWRPRGERRILLYGCGRTAAEFIRNVEQNPHFGLRVIGLVPESADQSLDPSIPELTRYPMLGHRDALVQVIEQQQVDAVVLTPESSWQDQLIDAVGRSEQTRADIFVIPSIFEMLISKMQHLQVEDIPLVEVVRNPSEGTSYYTRRMVDIVFSSLLLGLLAIPFLIVAVAIKLTSSGPVIYRQNRVGKDGRLFTVCKLRTMTADAEAGTGAVLARRSDARVTRLGHTLRRYHLDEIAQLWNILIGDMTFIGPRPERPEFVEEYSRTIPGYRERFKVKPGITGLAQVHGQYHTSAEMKLRYDLAYIYNQNLLMNVQIVLETIKIMVMATGV